MYCLIKQRMAYIQPSVLWSSRIHNPNELKDFFLPMPVKRVS